MRMPSVCPVVAHGWNIIEYLPLPKTLGWVSGGGANTLLGPGRAGPCGSFLVLEDHAPLCVWCLGVGGGGGVLVCLLVPALCLLHLVLGVWGCGCLVVDHGFFIVDASIWASQP